MGLPSLSLRRPVFAIVLKIAIMLFGIIGYTFLGTINATNENMVGPKKLLRKPPKKTNPYILYRMVFVDQLLTILGQVNKNKPKLISEKAAIHLARRFLFSF